MSDFASRVAALSPEKRELLIQRLKEQQAVTSPAPLPPLVPDAAARFSPFPLTDVQQAYYIGRGELYDLGGFANVYLEYEISYRLPPARPAPSGRAMAAWLLRTFWPAYIDRKVTQGFVSRLNAALRQMIVRHDMLRVVILPDGHQQVLPEAPDYQIAQLDLRGRRDAEEQLERERERLRYQRTPIDRWPLFEFVACLLDGQQLRLLVRVDPLIIDGESRGLLIAELGQLVLSPAQPLPPLTCSYRDYAVTWANSQGHPLIQRARAYWMQQLPTMPPAPELPLVRPAGAQQPVRFVMQPIALLDQPTWDRLKQRAAAAGLTPSGVTLAVFVEVLAAWSARRAFTLGLIGTYHPPLHPRIQEVFGNFNTIGLLVADPPRGPFVTRAIWLQKRLLADLDQPYFSGHAVLRELNRGNGGSAAATIPIYFNSVIDNSRESHPFNRSQEAREVGPRGPSIFQMSEVEVGPYIPQVLLMLIVREGSAGELLGKWQIVDGALPEGMSEEMQDAYQRLLLRLADDEAAWQERSLQMVTPEQIARRAAPTAAAPVCAETTLHRLIGDQASRRPASTAVVCGDRCRSYTDLLCAAERLARRLHGEGLDAGALVAVVLEPGWEHVVAALGALLAGAAYFAVPANLAPAQLSAALRESGAALALTAPAFDAALDWPARTRRICVGEAEPEAPAMPSLPADRPAEIACATLSLGPDGRVGGALITHAAAAGTIQTLSHYAAIGPDDRALAIAPLPAEQAIYQIFGILAAGGTLIFPEAGALGDPQAWAAAIARQRVTVWCSTPALLERLLACAEQSPCGRLRTLRTVLLSHDRIPPRLVERLRAQAPGCQVISMGGLPAAALWASMARIDRADPDWQRLPCGHPIAAQRVYVLDEELAPRPTWVPGQVYLGCAGAAAVLWGELATAGSTIKHPDSAEQLWRTGLRGRFLPDGALDLLGPADEAQAYRHGYHIDLHWIEATLERHAALRAACVVAVPHTDTRRGSRLIAYVVPAHGPSFDADALWEYLAGRLPEAMLPDRLVAREELPLTADGRIDRRVLQAASDEAPAPAVDTQPDELEQWISELWQQLLRAPAVGVADNFFELGGDSFLATLMLARVHETFQASVAASFFANPTIADLTHAIRRQIAHTPQRSS
jgi:non-ribosomal peptide synthetase component F